MGNNLKAGKSSQTRCTYFKTKGASSSLYPSRVKPTWQISQMAPWKIKGSHHLSEKDTEWESRTKSEMQIDLLWVFMLTKILKFYNFIKSVREGLAFKNLWGPTTPSCNTSHRCLRNEVATVTTRGHLDDFKCTLFCSTIPRSSEKRAKGEFCQSKRLIVTILRSFENLRSEGQRPSSPHHQYG